MQCDIDDVIGALVDVEFDFDVAVVEIAVCDYRVLVCFGITAFGCVVDKRAEFNFQTVFKQRFDVACNRHIACRNLIGRQNRCEQCVIDRRAVLEHARLTADVEFDDTFLDFEEIF